MQPPGIEPQRFWRETEFAWLFLLVLLAYFMRAGQLPMRGEESTRAQIALEMVEGKDWLVPKKYGEPFHIRPPLQNWVIAASCLLLGSWSEWAVRLPSMIATLLTVLMVYGYTRTFLSRLGAFAAAAALATMADMFAMGRQAETEALFIFLLSASLIGWHWSWVRGWPDLVSFAIGYGFMALAMLTKGLQAPLYFAGSMGLLLILSRQWRRLFSVSHVLGGLVGLGILAAWVLPYAQAMGWAEVHSIWFGDPAMRNSSVLNWDKRAMVLHLVSFPLEIFAGTLPWSLLLLPFLSRDFRRSLPGAGSQVRYAVICLAVAFPTCWLPPGGQPRFFAPLFPCLAVLVGAAVERALTWKCQWSTNARPAAGPAWQGFFLLGFVAMCGLIAALLTVAVLALFLPRLAPFAGPPLATLAYTAASVGLAWLTLRQRRAGDPAQARFAVLALAGFMVLAFSGAFFDIRVRRSENAPLAMQRLKERLPPGQELVCFGRDLDSLFFFYYGKPMLRSVPWPERENDATHPYFCFQCFGDQRPDLPFAWEEVGTVPLDRNQRPVPEEVAVVGRRVDRH